YDQRQQVEAIHKREHRGLLGHRVSDHSVSPLNRVWSAESARHQVMTRSPHELPNGLISGTEIAYQHALMILRSPLEHRGDERDTEASAPVAAEVGQARSLIVLVFWQI